MPFVYSTLANSNRYVQFRKGGGDLPVPVDEGVLIVGGAGVQTRNLLTPRGVATQVTDEQLAYLMDVPLFNLHVQNGFITTEAGREDAEAVAANMSADDPSRPLEPGDFEAGEEAATPAPEGVRSKRKSK